MSKRLTFSNHNLVEQFGEIYEAGKVTNNDLQRWKSIGLSPALRDEEVKLVGRLFHALA